MKARLIIFLLAVVALLWLNPGESFSQQHIILQTPDYGQKHYKARDYIEFQSGYSFSSTSGQLLTAETDPSLRCDVLYDSFPQSSELPRVLDHNFSVGATAGSFGVSPSGGANYQVPILVPPGTNGVQPQVSVAYNSQGGNGLLGQGWDIGGLSSVSRVSQNHYFDGAAKGVNLDSTDRFSLDGQRLLLQTGIYGSPNSTYSTEQESFSSVTLKNDPSLGISYFEVKTRDGKTIEYGRSADSNVNSGYSPTILFRISKITDNKGNYMIFNYHEENGESYIQEILYTGNQPLGRDPYNSIEFFYENRSDQKIHYLAHRAIPQKAILYKISVKSGEAMLREYAFKYTMDVVSKLVEIEESNAFYERVNSTVIRWERVGTTTVSGIFTLPSDNYNTPRDDRAFTSGDLNGDGLSDLISIFDEKDEDPMKKIIRAYKTTISPNGFPVFSLLWGREAPELRVFRNTDIWGNVKKAQVMGSSHVANIDGDPYPDLIVPLLRYGNDTDNKITFYIYKDSYYSPRTVETTLLNATNEMPAYAISDLNNDGLDDILMVDENYTNSQFKGKIWYMGKDFQYQEVDFNLSGLTHPPRMFHVFDFDSDGINDVMAISKDKYRIYKNHGTHVSTTPSATSTDFNSGYNYIKPGDFNGDGMMDFIINPDDTRDWMLALNNGNFGFSFHTISNMTAYDEPFTLENDPKGDCIVTDFNNDGKSDVIMIDAVYIEENDHGVFHYCDITWYASEGTQFAITDTLYAPYAYYSQTCFDVVGDFNGDGRTDLINFGGSLYPSMIKDENWRMYTSFNQGGAEGLVTSVSDGLGKRIGLKYRSLAHPTTPDNKVFYFNGYSQLSYPMAKIQAPLFCVWKTDSPDGLGASMTTEYSYNEARAHLKGKGFLGFKETTANSPLGKTISTTALNTNFYFPYLLSLVTYSPQNLLLSTVTNDPPTVFDLSGKRFLSYTPKSSQINYKTNSENTINTVINQTQMNVQGDILSEISTIKEGNTEVSRSETTFSGHDGNPSRQPGSVTTSYIRPGVSQFQRTSSFTYFPDGTLKTRTSDGVTESYTYPIGLSSPESVTTMAQGTDSIKTLMFYDPKGRFVEKTISALGDSVVELHGPMGEVLLSMEVNGHWTENQYDGWGRPVATILPDSRYLSTEYSWSEGAPGGDSSLYHVTAKNQGNETSTRYYDTLGRVVKEAATGHNGARFFTDTRYNARGQTVQVSEPYKEGQSPAHVTGYSYNDDGTLKVRTLENGVTETYAYQGNDVNVSYSTGETFTKKYDASGLLIESVDPGGTVKYTYNALGQATEIESPGGATRISYDQSGRQDTLIDPDAGTTIYGYDPLGRISTQTDARGKQTSMGYDKLGRVITKTIDGSSEIYAYDGENAKGLLMSIEREDGSSFVHFLYDSRQRLVSETKGDQEASFTKQYRYDLTGKLVGATYPNGFEISYHYDSYEQLSSIKLGSKTLWQLNQVNDKGLVEKVTYGNGKATNFSYDPHGRIDSIAVAGVLGFKYSFNNKGQLEYRGEYFHNPSGWEGFREDFDYDGVNRLLGASVNGVQTLSMEYDTLKNDRISSKSDFGPYSYVEEAQNHQLDLVVAGIGLGRSPQDVTYGASGEVTGIDQFDTGMPVKHLDIAYGVDGNRFKSGYSEDNNLKYERYFFGDYEKEVFADGSQRHLNYVYAGGSLVGIFEQTGTGQAMHYVYQDYLGSVRCITDENGNIEQALSFDAWGNRRNPVTGDTIGAQSNLMFARGFTGHEHLDEFGLINMNGRVYDPAIALFLSPDNFVQDPGNSQNFNRYTYALNNPLIYTDPSGESLIGWGIFLAFTYFKTAHANRDKETGKWAWNPLSWFGKDNNTTIVIGGSTNSNFSDFTFYGGVGSNNSFPSISYNTDHGLGYGNAGNPGFNEFYYPSVNYNLPEQNAINAINERIGNYKQSQENFRQFLKQRTSFVVGPLSMIGWEYDFDNTHVLTLNYFEIGGDFVLGGSGGIGWVKDEYTGKRRFIYGKNKFLSTTPSLGIRYNRMNYSYSGSTDYSIRFLNDNVAYEINIGGGPEVISAGVVFHRFGSNSQFYGNGAYFDIGPSLFPAEVDFGFSYSYLRKRYR